MEKIQTHCIRFPLSTEKAIRLMESDNKLVFAVDRKANKQSIKKDLESLYKIKVLKVNTHITVAGKKRAYVTLSPDHPAIDLATELGLM